MLIDSVRIAESLTRQACEIASAANLYQRLPFDRDNLAAGLESLVDRLNETYRVFLGKRAEETAHAPR